MRGDVRGGQSECPLVSVRLPPLPGRPPTPPPRPESSLLSPPSTPSTTSIPSPPSIQLPSPLSSLDHLSPITLSNPRSASSRAQNLYVDTPFKGAAGSEATSTKLPPIRSYQTRGRPGVKTQLPLPLSNSSVITSPPGPHSLDKPHLSSPSEPDSIICVVCGRCRCAACASPAPLPSHWLCNNSCHCSAQNAVDSLSCMCCVKAAFYHCGERLDQDSDKEEDWVESPCSCSSNKW